MSDDSHVGRVTSKRNVSLHVKQYANVRIWQLCGTILFFYPKKYVDQLEMKLSLQHPVFNQRVNFSTSQLMVHSNFAEDLLDKLLNSLHCILYHTTYSYRVSRVSCIFVEKSFLIFSLQFSIESVYRKFHYHSSFHCTLNFWECSEQIRYIDDDKTVRKICIKNLYENV